MGFPIFLFHQQLRHRTCYSNHWATNHSHDISSTAALSENYDCIVIGGGTEGFAVALCLTEDPKACALIIEAGENRLEDPKILTPGLATSLTTQNMTGISKVAFRWVLFRHLEQFYQCGLQKDQDPTPETFKEIAALAHEDEGIQSSERPHPNWVLWCCPSRQSLVRDLEEDHVGPKVWEEQLT